VVIPRGLFVIAMLVLLLLYHPGSNGISHLRARKDPRGRPVRLLIVGADSYAERAAARLEAISIYSCRVVGYVQLPETTTEVHRLPVCSVEEVTALAGSQSFDEVVIALHPAQFPRIRVSSTLWNA